MTDHETLLALRADIDQAVRLLDRLAPVLAAYQAPAALEAPGEAVDPGKAIPRPEPSSPSSAQHIPTAPPAESAAAETRTCAGPECGAPFVATGRGKGRRLYCSSRCRSRAYLDRQWRAGATAIDAQHARERNGADNASRSTS